MHLLVALLIVGLGVAVVLVGVHGSWQGAYAALTGAGMAAPSSPHVGGSTGTAGPGQRRPV